MVLDFKQFVFNDHFGQELNGVAVDFKIVHANDRHYVVDDTSAKTYFRDEMFAIGVNPVPEKGGLL